MHAHKLGSMAVAAMLANTVLTMDPKEEWEGTKSFPYWELGQLVFNAPRYYPACFPSVAPKNPIPSWPCSGLQFFFSNCTYGLSLDTVLDKDASFLNNPFDSGPDLPQLTNASQQSCYCQGDYWEYVRGCNACMYQHGYPQFADWDGGRATWIPSTLIEQQSSAYCGAAGSTMAALDFFASFTPPLSLAGDQSPVATALASTDSAVSDYFTISHTVVVPTQTSPIGTLATASSATAAPTATSNSRAEPTRMLSPGVVGGIGVAVAITGAL